MPIFLPLLTLLFIGLKLTGFIAWSWLWVLAPLWLGLAIVLVITAVCYLAGILLIFIANHLDKDSK